MTSQLMHDSNAIFSHAVACARTLNCTAIYSAATFLCSNRETHSSKDEPACSTESSRLKTNGTALNFVANTTVRLLFRIASLVACCSCTKSQALHSTERRMRRSQHGLPAHATYKPTDRARTKDLYDAGDFVQVRSTPDEW